MSKAGCKCALVVVALVGVASASASSPWRQQGSAAALDDAAHSRVNRFRAERRSEEDHSAEGASANGSGIKLMSTSQLEALSARLRDARAATGDLEGTADDQPPRKMVGTRYDVTGGTPDRGGGHRRRELQQACAAGSGVTVTSSEFPLLEGCLAEFEDARFINSQVEFSSTTGLIIAGVTEDDLLTEYWFAFYGDSVESTQACNSQEPASTVHPSEATWVCFFPDGSGGIATSTTFGVECGCDGVADDDGTGVVSPTPSTTTSSAATAAPASRGLDLTPAPTVSLVSSTGGPSTSSGDSATSTSPTPTVGGGCTAADSLGVTSTAYSLLEGCLEEFELFPGGEVEYVSSTGLVFAFAPDETSPLENWAAMYGDTTVLDELQLACFSAQEASTVHPSEATWLCFDAAGSANVATGSDFVVECGCDGEADDDSTGVVSPTPSTTTSSAATAAPVSRGLDLTPAPSVSLVSSTGAPSTTSTSSSPGAIAGPNTCTEASVSITSSEFPMLEDCLIEDDLFEGGEFEYLGPQGGLILAGNVTGETEPFWFAYYLEDLTSEAEPILACGSEEPASAVHPADATWICEFDSGFAQATATTFGVDCGCDGADDDGTTGGGGGGGGGIISPTPTTAATPAPSDISTDRGIITTPAPVSGGGDDDDSAANIFPGDDDTDDGNESSPGVIGGTDGAVGRSLSAWSAAAGAGATGVIAAVMTLAMGRW